MAQQSLDKRVQTAVCSRDFALVSLRICDVFLSVFHDSVYLLQDLLRQVWPGFDNILRYFLCPCFQLHILPLRFPRLYSDFIGLVVGFALSWAGGLGLRRNGYRELVGLFIPLWLLPRLRPLPIRCTGCGLCDSSCGSSAVAAPRRPASSFLSAAVIYTRPYQRVISIFRSQRGRKYVP